jgi:hypothetical protein
LQTGRHAWICGVELQESAHQHFGLGMQVVPTNSIHAMSPKILIRNVIGNRWARLRQLTLGGLSTAHMGNYGGIYPCVLKL